MKRALLSVMVIWGSVQLNAQTHPDVFEDWRTTAGTQHFFYKNVTKRMGQETYLWPAQL